MRINSTEARLKHMPRLDDTMLKEGRKKKRRKKKKRLLSSKIRNCHKSASSYTNVPTKYILLYVFWY